MNEPTETRTGLLYGLAAYGWWGFAVLYFKAVDHFDPSEVLAHRVIWSALLLTGLLLWRRRWGMAIHSLRSRRTVGTLVLSTMLIATTSSSRVWPSPPTKPTAAAAPSSTKANSPTCER